MNMNPHKNGPSWFTLSRKPDRTLTSSKNGSVLARVPIPHSPTALFSSLVAVGSDIYNIGVTQFIRKASSSSVSILDCRSHTWHEAPSLPVELFTVSASVLDRKIYVAEIYEDGDSDSDSLKNSFGVFDTKTQVWCPEPIPCSLAKGKTFSKSACIDGKVNVVTESQVLAFNPKEGSWDPVGPTMSECMYSNSYFVIENVLYSAYGAFRWYDSEVRTWRKLKGLVGLPKFPPGAHVRLADYGGKLAVLWNDGCSYEKMIWCAEIALERRNRCEIWGEVEWFDHVLRVPISFSFEKALAATL